MKKPLVSFCIPVHNAENFLEDTLRSIFEQDYSNIEIICVNDHSTDRSSDLLSKFSSTITVLEAPNFGAAAARNFAFKHANGEYIVFFDADDLIFPNYVSTQLSSIRDKNAVAICKWGRFFQIKESFQEDRNIVKRSMSFHEWIIHYWTYNLHTTPPGRILIPRGLLINAGLWDETLSLNDDLEFFTRVFASATEIVYNDDTCFFYRSGINGLSSKTKGYKYQVSNCKSFDKATKLAIDRFGNDPAIKKACANMWQQFVYENYPNNKDLITYANTQIRLYGGSEFPFPAGGFSALLAKIAGWKITKRFQLILATLRT